MRDRKDLYIETYWNILCCGTQMNLYLQQQKKKKVKIQNRLYGVN